MLFLTVTSIIKTRVDFYEAISGNFSVTIWQLTALSYRSIDLTAICVISINLEDSSRTKIEFNR